MQRMKDVKKLHLQHQLEKEGLKEQFEFIYQKYKERKSDLIKTKQKLEKEIQINEN
jgi:hypothetical protein